MIQATHLVDFQYNPTTVRNANRVYNSQEGFSSILSNTMGMLNDVNSLGKKAEAEEVAFALGESDNLHDLMIAEQKASIALQYTVAIKNKVIEAYNSIMQMQI